MAARIPFFLMTWRRKLRLTGAILGTFVAIRLMALATEQLVGLGWGDIPVSLLVLVYLAFLYMELWVILERHTRAILSVMAASFLAALCLASPFIEFDPVATGSIPERMRFWEPTLGMDVSGPHAITYLRRDFLDAGAANDEATLERQSAKVAEALGLAQPPKFGDEAWEEDVRRRLRDVAARSGLSGLRAELFAAAGVVHLHRAAYQAFSEAADSRAACVSELAEALEASEGPVAPPETCAPLSPNLVVPVEFSPPDGDVSIPSLLEAAEEVVDSWLERAGEHPGGLDLGPHDTGGFVARVRAVAAREQAPPPAWAWAKDAADRLSSTLPRALAKLGDIALLEAQIRVIPEQILAKLPEASAGGEKSIRWVPTETPELEKTFRSKDEPGLTKWLSSRPSEVLGYVDTIDDPERAERFLYYLSQTQHWHVRSPEKIKARLEEAEDEYRGPKALGDITMPPTSLCNAMEREGVDAAMLQLSRVGRSGTKELKLIGVFRDPCLVVWEHKVPIYSQADVVGGTADDAQAFTKAVADFFAPYPLGTDYLGRDMLIRLVKGTEGFFLPGLLAVLIGLGFGVLLGAIAGYMGGRVDQAITFFTTMVGSFPRLVFILLACTIPEDPSMMLIGAITGGLFIPQISEAVRRRVLTLKEEDFILASRAHGLGLPRILFYHIVWLQCFPEIVRQGLYLFVYVIFLETALSYLEGPGAPPEIPSWGRMLADATAAMFRGQYWHALVPTAAIVFTTLGVASLGDVIVGQAKEERL